MKSACKTLWAAAVALALVGCSEIQSAAGNSSETENTASAREISVDSLYANWLPHPAYPTVATLRLDSTNWDFSRTDSLGRQLTVEALDGRSIPFERIFWDSLEKRGRLRVRLQGPLLRHGARFRLRWGSDVVGWPDPIAVWDSISSYHRLLLTSVLVDDFEHGSLVSLLPNGVSWKSAAGPGATASAPKLAACGSLRSGNALMFTYSADAVSGKYSTLNVKLGDHPLSLRSLDSIVLWVRGSGRLSVALDRPDSTAAPKAWARMNIDSTWKRIRIRPTVEFLSADGVGGNIGWLGIRDSITHLTFLMEGGRELWIDDVRLHGIDNDDLR